MMMQASLVSAEQKKIIDLRFGSTDAVDYINDPNNPMSDFFRKSFYESSHLQKAIDPEIYFFIGDKGVGKTAYCAYASMYLSEYKATCSFFDTNDFTRFLEVCRNIGLDKSQYSVGWVFVFLCLMAQKLEGAYADQTAQKLTEINSAIRSSNLGGSIAKITSAIELLNDINLLFDNYASEAGGMSSRSASIAAARPSQKVSRFVDILISALSELSSEIQFTIFLDGLDVRPDDVSYDDYLSVVSSICNAVWVLNATQLAKLTPILKVTLLLRPDIFESVAIQNRGPKLQNHGHLVEWASSYDGYRTSEIFRFTDQVFYSQQSDTFRERKLFPGDCWDAYFPFTMPRRNDPKPDNPFILFLRHSFCKPRDIIKYLQLMQKFYPGTSENTSEYSFDASVFRNQEIKKEFSSYLLQEIRDQLNFYYTNKEYQQFLDFCNGYLGQHIDRREQLVEYSDFESAHNEYIAYNRKNNIPTAASFATADITLQFMFDLNVLGFRGEYKTKDGRTRPFTNFSYRKRSFANLRPKVPTAGRYSMHLGIARSLFTDLW